MLTLALLIAANFAAQVGRPGLIQFTEHAKTKSDEQIIAEFWRDKYSDEQWKSVKISNVRKAGKATDFLVKLNGRYDRWDEDGNAVLAKLSIGNARPLEYLYVIQEGKVRFISDEFQHRPEQPTKK